MVVRLPRWTIGQKIGLLGGSFNPAHDGHLLISQLALRRLRLDRLWWLVTPGNPLKQNAGLPDLASRIAAARALIGERRIEVSGLEAEIGARFTYDTIAWLVRRAPGVHFVWIMGADNLVQFHRWRNWRDIARLVPIAVIDRPGSTLRSATSHAGATLSRHRAAERDAGRLALMTPPAFLFMHGPRSSLSSTALRGEGIANETA
jgi:nicotinate-nucleotide adenylyltransferase